MDRNLQIALVSGALAIICGYALGERLRQGDTQIQFIMVTRRGSPKTFWTIMLALGIIETAFIGMTLMYFAAWLDTP
jgi:hypothetical protein